MTLSRVIAVLPLAAAAVIGPAQDHKNPTVLPDLTQEQLQAALPDIARQIDAKRSALKVPGMAVVIVKDGKVAMMRGFGYRDPDKKLPVTPDTLFQLASCSKAFTGVLLAMAADQGKLSLSDPPRKYLPFFHLKDPVADRSMTLADLMCHRSGLPRTDLAWASGSLTADECIQLLASDEPTFPYGENAQYSNVLVHTASEVAGKAFGQTWDEALRTHVFEPLGMTSTTVAPLDSLDQSRLAVGTWFDPTDGKVKHDDRIDALNIGGAGAIKSCARDMARWLQFHLDGGQIDGKRLISKKGLMEVYKPRIQWDDEDRYGFGWMIQDRYGVPVIWHDGFLPGFQAYVALVPSRHLGIAILTNNAGRGGNFAAAATILTRLVGKPDMKWQRQYGKEVGVYVDRTDSHLLRIWRSSLSLWAMFDRGKAIRLNRVGERTYHTASPNNEKLSITFRDDDYSLMHPAEPLAEVTRDGMAEVWRQHPIVELGPGAKELERRIAVATGGSADKRTYVGRYTVRYLQEGISGSGLLFTTPPDSFAEFEIDDAMGKRICEQLIGVNGDSGGAATTFSRLDPLMGPAAVDNQVESALLRGADTPSDYDHSEILAETTLGREPVWVLSRTPKNGSRILDFVSERTNLVLRREQGDAPSVWLFSDYRKVGDTKMPYRLVTVDTGFHVQVFRIQKYTPTSSYPHWAYFPSGFKKPEGASVGN